jgi:hypothetical protein
MSGRLKLCEFLLNHTWLNPQRIFAADYADETDYTDEFYGFIRAIRFIRVIRGKNSCGLSTARVLRSSPGASFLKDPLRIPRDFPQMRIGILKIAGVTAPPSLMRSLDNARACS